MKLLAPDSYYELSHEDTLSIVNGCGPSNWKYKLDNVLGVNLFDACAIHDYDYFLGGSSGDRERADFNFLVNCMLLIVKVGTWRKSYRLAGCLVFYGVVRVKGRKHFNYA